MTSSVGMMTFPIYGTIIQTFQSTNHDDDIASLSNYYITKLFIHIHTVPRSRRIHIHHVQSHLEAKVETAPVDRDDFQCFGLSTAAQPQPQLSHIIPRDRLSKNEIPGNTHRIHGAGIYANMWGILMESMAHHI